MALKIETARANAKNLRTILDSNDRLYEKELNSAKNLMKQHLNNKIENPTIGLMAEKRDFFDPAQKYPTKFLKNLKQISEDTEIINLEQKVEKQFKSLYPKSGKTRTRLINNERIVFYGYRKIFSLKNLIKSFIKRH